MIDLTFEHEWQAETLSARPLILPQRHFVYPAQVEEVGARRAGSDRSPGQTRSLFWPRVLWALLVLRFLPAYGPALIHPGICIAAGGYVYLIDTREPGSWEQIEYRPVTGISSGRAASASGLFRRSLFVGLGQGRQRLADRPTHVGRTSSHCDRGRNSLRLRLGNEDRPRTRISS